MSKTQDPSNLDWQGGDLNAAEKLFIERVGSGEPIELGGETLRGSVVRHVLCGRESGGADRFRSTLKIADCVVSGGLDLEDCTITRRLVLERSRIEGDGQGCAILLRDACARNIVFDDTVIEGAILAERIEVDGGVFVTNCKVDGEIAICEGKIGDTFSLEGTQFGNGVRALFGEGVQCNDRMVLRKAISRGALLIGRARLNAGLDASDLEISEHGGEWGFDARAVQMGGDFLLERASVEGALCVAHGEIDGQLVLDGLKLNCGREVGIAAFGVNVAHGVSARFAIIRGSVILRAAQIAKGISSSGLEVSGGDIAIDADGVAIGGNWDLSGAKLIGDFKLAGAAIDGQLKLTQARLFGSEVAVRADGARIDGGCFMSRAIVIGMLRFPATKIGNQFRLRGASLKVDYGAALLASGSVFSRDVELNGGMESAGALIFDQVEIRGTLNLSDSITSSAVLARVGVSSTPDRAREGTEEVYDEIALSLVDAEVNRVVMPGEVDQRPKGIVVLSRAHVGAYHDFAAAWPPEFDERAVSSDGRDIDHFVLDGFTYDHMSNPSGARTMAGEHSRAEDRVGARRLMWLGGQEACEIRDHFKPQPWVQLSQRLAAQGYHEDARNISIARQRLALSSHSTSAAQRWQGRILDLFALYGHNPWRTIVWMGFFILAFAAAWAWAAGSCRDRECFDESVFVVTNRDAYTSDKFAQSYPGFNALAYSFDVFVPFVSFGYADHWRPNLSFGPIGDVSIPNLSRGPARLESDASRSPAVGDETDGARAGLIHITRGGLLYVLMVIEMIIGLALSSLAITGFTGLLRSD